MKLNRKLTGVLALTVASSMMLTACGGSSSSSEPATPNANSSENQANQPNENNNVAQVLTFNLGAEPAHLDPQLNQTFDGRHTINNTFEGLVREKDGEIVPAMAESWEISDDGLVYTFKINPDAKWSDGQPVVAGDFEFAWKRAINISIAPGYAELLASGNIVNAAEIIAGELSHEDLGVRAIDDSTFEVTLTVPTEYFMSLAAFPSFMPVREDVVDNDGLWAKDPSRVVSNGPFVLTEFLMGDRLVLEPNPYYLFADEVKLDKIEGRFIVEASTALTAFMTDTLLINDVVPVDEIPRLTIEDPEFYIIPQIATYYYVFNTELELFEDINVRKALNLAIDREAIVNQVSRAGEQPATALVGPGFTDPNGNDFNAVAGDFGIPLTADIEGAQAALAAAGYPNGEGFPELTVMYNTNDGHKRIAEAIQEMWKQNLNIDIKLENQEWGVFLDTRGAGQFEIARSGWTGKYLDPTTMLEILTSTHANNDGSYYNAEYDDLMRKAANATGMEHWEYLYEAQEVAMSDYPIIPIYYYVNTIHASDAVQNWQLTPMSMYWFGNAYIQ